MFEEKFPNVILKSVGTLVYFINEIQTLYGVYTPWMRATIISIISKIPAKKWGDTEIAERGRSVLVMRARYRSA